MQTQKTQTQQPPKTTTTQTQQKPQTQQTTGGKVNVSQNQNQNNNQQHQYGEFQQQRGRGGFRGRGRGRGGFRGGSRGGFRGRGRGGFRGRGRGGFRGRGRGGGRKFENTNETFLTRFPHFANKKEIVDDVYNKNKENIEKAIRDLTEIDKTEFLKKFKINEIVKSEDEVNSIVKEVKGDLFTSQDSLCHCVSEDLAMSKGVAVGFVKHFGGKEDLQKQGKKPGQVAFLQVDKKFIFYLITKEKFFQIPSYENLWKAINEMKKIAKENKVTGISMPVIACGLDRLEWKTVKTLIAAAFKGEKISITVYIWEKRVFNKQNDDENDDEEHHEDGEEEHEEDHDEKQ